MSAPKRWVSSKVHRKTSSRPSFTSSLSGSYPLEEGLPPSPPTRLPKEDTTASTTIIDFGSASTLATHRSECPPGGPPTVGSSSSISIDSSNSALTHSPSTTPPKKAWEKNYKSFLKRSGKHGKPPSSSAAAHKASIKQLPRPHSSHSAARSMSESDNASAVLSGTKHQPLFASQNQEDWGNSLADGFEDHSNHSYRELLSTSADDKRSLVAPPSPSRSKERGGAFLKRLGSRSKTKSVDNLDTTIRKGVDRKSPSNTPPGSAVSTPMSKHSPLSTSPGRLTPSEEGLEKAAMLSDLLVPPTLSSTTAGSPGKSKKLGIFPAHHHRKILSQGNLVDDSLDQARHRGHTVSLDPSVTFQRRQTTATPPNPPTSFSRVQSMVSNLHIPEGEPVVAHDKQGEILREKRKAFTDFHNMGIDSSSAYLGDESSLHKHSGFLSSMAYPAGSAGGKVNSRSTLSMSGPHSLDQKREISPSTSMSSIAEKGPMHVEGEDTLAPDRALRSLKGPELWTKGERHAIIPGVLCMCPIQVLNSVMSKDEAGRVPSRPSMTSSRGSQPSFGIGSVISEDDGVESGGHNEWFFADHHQPSASGGTTQYPRQSGMSNNDSAFGKITLGKATCAPLGMRSFLTEVYGWCTGVFVLRQNYLFEYREGDSLNGIPWGYAHLPLAEAYPHKHFTNALHLDFFERPCSNSGKRSLLLRVESKSERDRWVSLLQSAARMTVDDLYVVDESDGAPKFGHGRYAVVRPAKRRDRQRTRSFSIGASQDSFRNISSLESLGGYNASSNTDLEDAAVEHNCALKIIDKREFWSRVKKGRERADTLVREAAVQTTLSVQGSDTPGLLRLRNIFETGEKLVFELELLKGTDLFQHVSSRGVLDEVEAANIMRDLLSSLNVLDQVGIAHRDIKPANLLMCHEGNGDGTRVKLADYGMASFVGVDNLVRGRCGTPGFVAPEILLTPINGGYGNKVDMFSAGVTLYVMLAGYEPFYGESDKELIHANREAKVDFPHADWHSVSVEGRDLIERMLVVDPAKRIGPSEALRHPWITRRATALQDQECRQAVCSTS
ncbi:hypothetical protein ACHAXT_005303 [Thalassiosira profunda]